MALDATGDFSRSAEVAGRIKDISLRESVLQYLYYDVARAAIESGDWPMADAYVPRVAARELRTLLYVKLAHAALDRRDRTRAFESLTEIKRLGEGISDPKPKAAVLLAAAAAFAQFDPVETDDVLRQAIKLVNSSDSDDIDRFSILRRVNMVCAGEPQPRWFGSSEEADQFSLIDTLARFSTSDRGGAIALARSLQNPASRIRALAGIAKISLGKASQIQPSLTKH